MKPSDSPAFSLLDNSTEFLYGTTDLELGVLKSNKLFRKQFCINTQLFKGKPFHEVVQSIQIDKLIRARENCIKNPGKVIILEIKSYHQQEEHWYRWEMSAICEDQKNISEISFIGTDITHQKKVEQELINQAVLMDNISDVVISTDINHCIKSWNFSSELLFGFTPEEVLNKPITDFISIKTLQQSNEEVIDIILKKGFWKGEMLIKNKKGKVFFLQSAISLLGNPRGEHAGFLTVSKDITAEKKATDELVIMKDEFQSFMENTSAMAWINDENGILFYMNSMYKKVVGLNDNAIGKSLFNRFPDVMTRGWKETDAAVLNNNSRIDQVEKGIDSNGNDIYYQVYKFPVKTLSGKNLVGGQAINITEKTIYGIELEKQKTQFHSFMENTPSLAWINDAEGKLFYMNSLFKKTFQLDDDVVGKNIYDFYPESMRPNCIASDQLVLETNSNVEVFEEGIDPEGKTIFYRVYKFPVQGHNGKQLIGGQAIDITIETITNQLLTRERNQFTSFMENAPMLAWIVDEKGITRYMNNRYKISSNFTDENLNKDNHHLYPEAIREKARKSIEEVLHDNQIINYQYSYVDKTGKSRYFDARKFPIIEADGKRYVGGHSTEVTDIAEANEKVVKEKNRFQSFMENAPQLAWVVDENNQVLYMNSRFMQAFNYLDENLGKNINEVDSCESTPEALQHNREVIEKNKAIEYLQQWINSKGEVQYFRTYKFPVPGPDGKMMVGAQAIDITKEVVAKQALDKMHERFEYAGRATRDVIWDWDMETNRIQRFGGNTFFKFGDKVEMMDFNDDNIHPDDVNKAAASLQKAIDTDAERWMSEFRYKCAEGEYKKVIDQAYIIRNKNGKAIRIIGAMQDVTEERRLQQEVLEAEQKKKQYMVTAALVAQEIERKELSDELHDNVNQLLASALLFLKIADKQPSVTGEYISQSIVYINNAVEEIRNISHTLNPGILKQNGICAALEEMASGLYIPGKFIVVFSGNYVKEDRISKELQLALYRIVQENMNNILKYAEATEVLINLTDKDHNIILEIADNGKGFDQSLAVRGLGITNIFSRAESFGGKAELITSPDNGCTITVTIPVSGL